MLDKINAVDPLLISEAIADRHYETIKAITKCFIDNTNENYKKCSDFAAYLAYATQFIILVKHSKKEKEVKASYQSVEKEINDR